MHSPFDAFFDMLRMNFMVARFLQELLVRRAQGVSHQERQAIAEWQQAETDRDHACSLLDVAIQLRQDHIHKHLDE